MADSLKFTYLFGIKKQTNKQKKKPKKNPKQNQKKRRKNTNTIRVYIYTNNLNLWHSGKSSYLYRN